MGSQLALFQSAAAFGIAGAVLAMSTQVCLWTGLLSLATASFAVVGGFGGTWLLAHTGIGLYETAAIATLTSAAVGVIVGRLISRLETDWLALATIALVLISRVFVVNLGDVTGGPAGEVVSDSFSIIALGGMLVGACIFMELLRRSKFGAAADTTRGDPMVAAALGIPVSRIRVIAFGISGGLGGLGGLMMASELQFIDPDSLFIDVALLALGGAVLGGAYHWLGSVIGAIVFSALPVYISEYFSFGQPIINGALLIVLIIWLPNGIVDPLRFRRWVYRRRLIRRIPSGPSGKGITS